MKKRILSSLLMGALFVASMSTFTSCKDYDDDINNLQAQIDKAALASDVTTLKTTVDAAATNANSALTKAEAAATQAGANQTAIAAVKATADKAATDVATVIASAAKAQTTADASATAAAAAQKTADQAVADAAAAQKDATSALTQLGTLEKTYVTSKALSSALDSVKTNINAAVDTVAFNALKKQVASFKGSIEELYKAITDVSLVGTICWNDQGIACLNGYNGLWFETGNVKDNLTFGKEEKDATGAKHSATTTVTYTKGGPLNFPTQLVIRVNPTNAVPTANMINLIDSKGNDLTDFIDVVRVEKFNTLLTRGTSETGLWTVKLQLKHAVDDPTTTDIAKKDANGNLILYAVAINNTLDKDSSRYAVSTYDVTIDGAYSYSGPTSLDYVKIKSETSMTNWQLLSASKARDTRTAGTLIPATSGENITVSFENLPKVNKFYIVRDDAYADESGASELNAWKSYGYTGLGEITDVDGGTGTKNITISIPSTLKTGDEVGFRIFAVNYDGTLVEKNGAAFYVYVGADANATSVTGNLYATSTMPTSEWLPITGTLKDGAGLPGGATIDVNGTKFYANVSYAQNTSGKPITKNSEAKYIKFVMTDNIQPWTDGATGTCQLTTTDAKGITENTINVKLTKVLPDAEWTKTNKKYSWKDGQLINGVYTAYMYPGAATLTSATWTTAATATTEGYKNLNEAINNLAGFKVTIANAVYNNSTKKYTDDLEVNQSSQTIEVDKAVIDNTTEHETTIGYNYGKVSSTDASKDYVVNVETVKTIFACPLNTTAQTYAWEKCITTAATSSTAAVYSDVNVLTYGSAATIKDVTSTAVNIFDYIQGKNAFDNGIFGKTLKDLVKTNQRYVAIKAGSISLVSNGSGKEDYFTIDPTSYTTGVLTFKVVEDGASNPAVDVPSTLKFTLTDAFGHDNAYTLPFTVKRRQ